MYNEKDINVARVFAVIEKGIVVVKITEVTLPPTLENLRYHSNGHEQQFMTPHLIVTPSEIYKSDEINIRSKSSRNRKW